MGQIASLVLNDGTANQTFTFASEKSDKAGNNTLVFENRAVGTPLGFPSVEVFYRPGSSADTSARSMRVSITYPIVIAATSTTPAMVSHTLRFKDGFFYMPNRATVAERTILWNLGKNLLAHASIQTLVVNAEPPYN